MINELNNEFAKFPKLKNYLYTRALKSGKAFGEDLELFLPGLFNISGKKSEKEAKRNQEYDINIEGKKYSLKSSTSKEMQISTLSDNNKNRIYFDKDILQATTLSAAYIRTLINSYGLEDFIFGFVNKNKITIGMFSVSNFLNLIDNVKLVQKETHRPLCLYDKNNNLIAEIKDDTGKPKANAFQRGLWIKNLNLVEKAGVFYDTVELDASEIKTIDLINLFK